jgi:hyaluronoglucosaminidase
MSLGIIEGYYGKVWSYADREETIRFLAPHGYGFFIYAPKFDAFLRKRWREPYPEETAAALKQTARAAADAGVEFGVGLSPFELYLDFNADAKAALADKLAQLSDLGVKSLAVLFDDMKGDVEGLARSQIEILHWIGAHTAIPRLITCPSYYTTSPMLDRVFGPRPPDYLPDLGRDLDPAWEVFWTGEEVCSKEFTVGHLQAVGEILRRKPLLWDNYPVNDSPVMAQSLHLRAFTGRPAAIGAHISGHAVNPALQPRLSWLPALTLAESYRQGEAYCYGAAFRPAADLAYGPDLGAMLEKHLYLLQDRGLDRLGEIKDRLLASYGALDHPAAREVVAWLKGEYLADPAEIAAT